MGLRFLSQEWLDRQRELDQGAPARPGASGRFQHVVTIGRKEEVAFVATVVDGRTTTSELGRADDDDVDATLIVTYADAVAMLRGELEPDVAFMRGEMKLRGDMATLLAVLPGWVTPEARAARATLAAETDLG